MPKDKTTPATTPPADELRERVPAEGPSALSDEELLNLVLSRYPVSEDPSMGKRLLERFGGLGALFRSSMVELSYIEGITEDDARRVQSIGELLRRSVEDFPLTGRSVSDSAHLQRYLVGRLGRRNDECMLLIFLDESGTILGEEMIAEGTVNQVIAFPRRIMRTALQYNAVSLIMAHNHPHGPPLPSLADREEADRLRDLLAPFEITLRDSLVVGRNRCFSIFENRPL